MKPLDVGKLRREFTAPHELVKTSDGKTLFLRHWVDDSGLTWRFWSSMG